MDIKEGRKAKYERCAIDAVKDFSAGMKKIDICKKYNITTNTLQLWLKKNEGQYFGEVITQQHEKNKEKELKEEKQFQLALLRSHADINHTICGLKNKTKEIKELIEEIAQLKCAIKQIAKQNMQLIDKILSET